MAEPNWLSAAWGRFKGAQRVQPVGQRLTQDQLRAAWVVWDLMRKAEAQDSDELHRRTVEVVSAMDPERRHGPKVFAAWLAANREALERQTKRRTVTDSAGHTQDSVAVELIRDPAPEEGDDGEE